MADLRCSVCFFLPDPLDLEDDSEIIIKSGYSLCDEHAWVESQLSHAQAINEGNKASLPQ